VEPILKMLPLEPMLSRLPTLPILSTLAALARLLTLAKLYMLNRLRKLPLLLMLARDAVERWNPRASCSLTEAIAICNILPLGADRLHESECVEGQVILLLIGV